MAKVEFICEPIVKDVVRPVVKDVVMPVPKFYEIHKEKTDSGSWLFILIGITILLLMWYYSDKVVAMFKNTKNKIIELWNSSSGPPSKDDEEN